METFTREVMRIKSFPKYTMLRIAWFDILSDSSWHNRKEIDEAQSMEVWSLGFFLQNKKKDLKIAHSVSNDGESDYTVIPWACIKYIEELNHYGSD